MPRPELDLATLRRRLQPGRMAMSGLNVVVRAASAVDTVKVSGRFQPVPIRAPPQPWSSVSRASAVNRSRLLCPSTVSSSRWPAVTWLGMYQRNSMPILSTLCAVT